MPLVFRNRPGCSLNSARNNSGACKYLRLSILSLWATAWAGNLTECNDQLAWSSFWRYIDFDSVKMLNIFRQSSSSAAAAGIVTCNIVPAQFHRARTKKAKIVDQLFLVCLSLSFPVWFSLGPFFIFLFGTRCYPLYFSSWLLVVDFVNALIAAAAVGVVVSVVMLIMAMAVATAMMMMVLANHISLAAPECRKSRITSIGAIAAAVAIASTAIERERYLERRQLQQSWKATKTTKKMATSAHLFVNSARRVTLPVCSAPSFSSCRRRFAAIYLVPLHDSSRSLRLLAVGHCANFRVVLLPLYWRPNL